jgi:chromosome segregation protein
MVDFKRLRLSGFKSFVDPTELVIEPGLTGIVGPNGCGKSNLVEALRWVMGENSPKSMRGSGMEDVIFAGTTGRPSRNFADVTLMLDNSDRTAPAHINDSDELEVTRRIEREMGSAYRINGRDARMRDVQLLFADQATGAHSPALVSQGRIGAIVTAKPQDRRAILEEAAGISGLHGRRKEAEQRLRAAEGNLTRIDDVLTQMETQIAALRRQARQAERYRVLSTDIRLVEGTLLFRRWREAAEKLADAQEQLQTTDALVSDLTREAAKISTLQTDAAAELPDMRQAEAEAAAALQRLKLAADELAAEEQRVLARQEQLRALLEDVVKDRAREQQLESDCAAALERLGAEKQTLADRIAAVESDMQTAQAKTAEAEKLASEGERSFDAMTQRNAEALARKRALEGQVETAKIRIQRLGVDIERLGEERARLEAEAGSGELGDAETRTLSAETALTDLIRKIADAESARAKAESTRDKIRARAESEHDSVRARAEAMRDRVRIDSEAKREQARAQAEATREQARAQAEQLRETALAAARDALTILTGLRAEHAVIERLLAETPTTDGIPVLDQVTVQPGFEKALGAALADDLSAPVGGEGARRWASHSMRQPGDGDLPPGVRALSSLVQAPAGLARRLAQIGVIDGNGSDYVSQLKVGQRLVSTDGQLWRWDGFYAAAPENGSAAERLAQRNRMAVLLTELATATTVHEAAESASQSAQSQAQAMLAQVDETSRATIDAATAQAQAALEDVQARASREIEDANAAALQQIEQAQTDVTSAITTERELRDSRRAAEQELDAARKSQAALREIANRRDARLQGLTDAITRLTEESKAREAEVTATEELMAGLPDLDRLLVEITDQRKIVDRRRSELAAARVELDGLLRRVHSDQDRITAIDAESSSWQARLEGGRAQVSVLSARETASREELAMLEKKPAEIEAERHALASKLTSAESARQQAADILAEAENKLRELDKRARDITERMAQGRENRARLEAITENQSSRRSEVAAQITELYQVPPIELPAHLEIADAENLPAPAELEPKLEKLKAERERLGAVNLLAEQELHDIDVERIRIDTERNELVEAIAKLRGAIGSLNREGRQRLLGAFDTVNNHFRNLFTTLFGGGEAYLTLIDSDDPLEAGLEIMASPPGKKLQSLTLLSGGEQALTATALIFAVFLTNPSPICVLDEVDAPLDDANVERYCDLLLDMTKRSKTRFLIITHNAVTMSRMDRLFGVTMAERGVSQLVSVDLRRAEQLLAAE